MFDVVCRKVFLVRLGCLLCGAQVYDSGNGLLAPRVWWCLSYHGHPAPLILDGGYARWVKEGRNTELAEPCPLTASPDFQQWHTGCNMDQKNALQGSAGQNRNSKVTYILLPCCHSVHGCGSHDVAVLGGMWVRWGNMMGTGDNAVQSSLHELQLLWPHLVYRLTETLHTLCNVLMTVHWWISQMHAENRQFTCFCLR